MITDRGSLEASVFLFRLFVYYLVVDAKLDRPIVPRSLMVTQEGGLGRGLGFEKEEGREGGGGELPWSLRGTETGYETPWLEVTQFVHSI